MGLGPVKPESGIPATQKISKNSTISAKNSPSPNIPVQNSSMKNSAGTYPTGTLALIKQTLLSLGLAQDSLNKALLIFTRFFSLPTGNAANPGSLLTELRREVLNTALQTNLDETNETENKALAAAIFADKGVKVSPTVMEAYTKAMEPTADEEQQSENAGNDENNSGNNNGEPDPHQNRSGNGNPNSENKNEPDSREPDPKKLRALFDEFMNLSNTMEPNVSSETSVRKQEILSILNWLPGRNGQRWIVWPFNVIINGVELRVLVRLLLKEPLSTAQNRLIVNVAGPINSWAFILDKSGREKLKASISVYPEQKQAKLEALKKEAERFLSAFAPIEIELRNGKKSPSLADFLEKEVMLTINGEF